MAAYATVAQAIDLYSEAYITVACDRDQDGAVDTDSFEKHLRVASRQMDAFLLGRYPLPLSSPPEHFQKLCVDIAIRNGAPTADVLTEEMKARHLEAIEYMKLIATNKVKLEISADTTTANASVTPQIQTRHDLSLQPASREMRRDRLRRLL